MQATRPLLRFGLCTALVVSIGTFALTLSASAVPTSYLPLYGTTVPASMDAPSSVIRVGM